MSEDVKPYLVTPMVQVHGEHRLVFRWSADHRIPMRLEQLVGAHLVRAGSAK